MRAEILAIGTEILLGEIVDSNSAYLAGRLPSLGIGLYRITQLGDNLGRVVKFLTDALEANDLVITTGGLGPTEDDLTREAVAQAFDETTSVDPETAERLRTWFSVRNHPMPERNLKQAWIIPSARFLANPRGTAPGWWVEKNGRILVSMPGPPSEMRPMWEAEVEPRLRERGGAEVILTRTIKSSGVGEGRVDELISSILRSENPTVGVYSRADGIHVRLGARAADREAAMELIRPLEAFILEALGPAVWGTDDDSLQGMVMKRLAMQGRTLGIVEDTTTGGAVAATISQAATPDVAAVLLGAEVHRGRPGSASAARIRAHAARIRTGASIGLGFAGSAMPGGELHVALTDDDGEDAAFFVPTLSMSTMRNRATTHALSLLRRRYLLT